MKTGNKGMKFKLSQTANVTYCGKPNPDFVPDLPSEIEFKTLEELMEFVKKHDVVIIHMWCRPEIEIYNGYRE